MKITVLQENLHKVMSGVVRIIASRPQLPVLANVLLKAEKGKLMVVGTDTVTTIGLFLGGKIEEEGEITVPAKDFASLISDLAPGRITLWSEKGKLNMVAGNTKASLVGILAEEFPEVSWNGGKKVTVLGTALAEAITRTSYALSGDEGRPVLTGVRITNAKLAKQKQKQTDVNNGLTFMATDGYRLSLVQLSKIEGELEEIIVVPGKTLAEVGRLVGKEKIGIQMIDNEEIVFILEDGWIKGKLLAGDFPEVEKILPDKFELEISVEKTDLERAIRTAAIFARETANIIKFKIANDKLASSAGKLQITANSPQIGENETTLDIMGKGDGEIAFNSRYLLEYLGSVAEAEKIVFKMVSPIRPGVFLVAGDNSYTHVIMPVRVQK